MDLFKLIQAKRQSMSEAFRASQDILDKAESENRSLTNEEDGQFKEKNATFCGLKNEVENLEAQRAAENVLSNLQPATEPGVELGTPDAEMRRDAMVGWMRRQSKLELTERQTAACAACGIRPDQRALDLTLRAEAPRTLEEARSDYGEAEARALSALDGTSGGILAPGEFVTRLETALLTFGGVRSVAEIIRTTHGNRMEWPTFDDTSNTGERIGESKTVTEQDVAFKGFALEAYKYSSKMIKVPVELLEDAAFNIPGLLGSALGERVGRKQNTDFTTGDDANGPQGIVTGATQGALTASTTAVIPAELITLVHSVEQAYRVGGGFMLHDLILAALRKLKGTDVYFFQGDFQGGPPTSILGYPFTINQDMDSTLVATKKIALFGQLSSYKVREVRTVRLRRLVERYAEYDQEGFVALARADGAVLDAGTHPIKYLQMKLS